MNKISYPDQEPTIIGWCAGCGTEIYSDQEYFLDGETMIHATGHIFRAKHDNQFYPYTCLMNYLNESGLFDEAALALGMERRKNGHL